ncbi:transcription factor bHLH68-like isoform X2 [Salvia splendens]|uniref:transcription factor bHLH68-like isoform X2 n=1 Tax=Salvia splendens TaxID=180675 RepID=UPI001C274671|nr:transcription factor bHLH68-like isoform X2 [Salvia splendens]
MNEGILPLQQMAARGLQNHTAPPLTAPLPPWLPSQEFPQSWSQLVLGFGGEEDKVDGIDPAASYAYASGNLESTTAKSSSMCPNMPGFSNKSSEGATKKSKMNPTTSAQSGIKVRKEKLGDRITALHQLVSPFGKTDTASVLLEAIGYIRFLQRQIEALSIPYLATHSQNVKRESGSCLFPEDPGQLLNESQRKRKAVSEEECEEEVKKDLKSRGLCLVPLSCTVDFGSENGADYWAPSFAGNF